MKKSSFILLFASFALFGCQKNLTDMPISPFFDTYVRIGMRSEYNVNLRSLDSEEYVELKAAIDDYKDKDSDFETNKGVTKVVRKEETRDLKYAYFGKEVSSVSLCSMLSRTDTESRYLNDNNRSYVTIKKAVSNRQNQNANAGIIKTNSTTCDYIYDSHYVKPQTYTEVEQKYGVRTSIKNNSEAAVVMQTTPEETSYDSTKFDLKPFGDKIQQHFVPGEVRGEDYNFEILGESAVFGQCNIGTKPYTLIKEGYSVFAPYTTTVGRTYKAVDNYFYEGLLEDDTTNGLRFTSFRFYHELLILSQAYNGINVPVLYLARPVVVEYSEVKYDISYNDLGTCEETIPEVTTDL